MAWGAAKGVENLISRLQSNDPTLTSLHLFQGKQFGNEEATELAKALEGNSHLTELYASGHELDAEAVKLLAVAVAKNQTLRVLCIGNASFGDSGTVALVGGLAGNTTLQQLDLESKSLGPRGAAALGKALSTGLGVETLLLARNPLTNEGAAELAQGLAGSKVAHLDLRDCSLTAEGVGSLAQNLPSTLTILQLDENNLGPEGAELLAAALAEHPSLQELHVSDTSIGDAGLAALVTASASTQVRVLEANRCGISPEGAQLLGTALGKGSPLEVLRLRDNSIEDGGAELLGAALAGASHVQELDLGNNQMGPGAGQILQGGAQLKKLCLHNSQLGDHGAIALANLLASSTFTALQELELSGCEIGYDGASRLFEVLQGFAAPALEVLLLAGNPVVNDPDFDMHVDVLCTSRQDLDVVSRGGSEAPPIAADGGPPAAVVPQNWSVSNDSDGGAQ